jgi:hypothetical protein
MGFLKIKLHFFVYTLNIYRYPYATPVSEPYRRSWGRRRSGTRYLWLRLCYLFGRSGSATQQKIVALYTVPPTCYAYNCFFLTLSPELEFTVVCLQILVWIYVNAIHSCGFILDLPANIDFWNLYNSILAGESVCL